MKLKKFLKWTIIILLVLTTIFVTCFLFFKFLNKDKVKTASVSALLGSEQKEDMETGVNAIASSLKLDGDDRFDILLTVDGKLNDMLDTLTGYYLVNDGKVENNTVASLVSNLTNEHQTLNDMVREYNIKITSSYFDRHLGANDLYQEYCNYLSTSAKLVVSLNDCLSAVGVDFSKELKFSIFEVYANIVVKDLSETKIVDNKRVLKSNDDLNFINNCVKVKYSLIGDVDNFSNSVDNFVANYSKCDKSLFASSVRSKCSTVTTVGGNYLDNAVYYFKAIFGV